MRRVCPSVLAWSAGTFFPAPGNTRKGLASSTHFSSMMVWPLLLVSSTMSFSSSGSKTWGTESLRAPTDKGSQRQRRGITRGDYLLGVCSFLRLFLRGLCWRHLADWHPKSSHIFWRNLSDMRNEMAEYIVSALGAGAHFVSRNNVKRLLWDYPQPRLPPFLFCLLQSKELASNHSSLSISGEWHTTLCVFCILVKIMQNIALHGDATCLKSLQKHHSPHLFSTLQGDAESVETILIKGRVWVGRWSQQLQRCRRPDHCLLTISLLWDGEGDRAAMGPDQTALLHLQPPPPFCILPLRARSLNLLSPWATGFLSSEPIPFNFWTLTAFTQSPCFPRRGSVSVFCRAQDFVDA